MGKITTWLAACACACGAAIGYGGCAKPSENVALARPSEVQQAIDNLPPPDREFVLQAASSNLAAIRIGQLAMERSRNPNVKAVARQLVDAHTALLDTLRYRARNEAQVVLPIAELTPEQAEIYTHLASLSEPEFDDAFFSAIVTLQEETIESFNREAVEGQDNGIRATANDSLPLLNDRVRQVRRQMHIM